MTIDVGVAPAIRLAGGATLSYMDLASIVLTIAFFVALYLFFSFTRLGVQFRGTAENALLASQRGVNVNLVLSLAWVIAVMAAIAVRRAVRRPRVPQHRERDHRAWPG